MGVLSFIISCLAGAVLYRIGGSDLNLPLKAKWRDWGVPAVGVYVLFQMLPMYSYMWHYVALAGFFGASWGSLSLSGDYWGSDDIEWYERVLSGFLKGLSALPIAFYTGRWIGFVIRIIILSLFMPFSNKLKYEWLVEPSRGFIFIATLPLLAI